MANVKFSRKEIEKYIKLNEKNLEIINMLGIPALLDSEHLEIEVFPNRPDIISMHGFIRALKAFMGKEPGLKKYKINKPEKEFRVKIDSSVNEVRPYTVCAIVKNLAFDNEKIKEIIDMQEKLHSTIGRNRKKAAIGIYPLEKIKLPITYEAKKPDEIKFTPLESTEEMTASEILRKHPTGREFASLLEKHEKYPIFVDSAKKILSMPPVINSNDTGKITSSTKDVFIECSGFNLDVLKKTLNIVVSTLAEMGGKIYALNLDYEKNKIITPDFEPQIQKISLENTNKLLGLDLKEKDLEKLLAKMGFEYKKGKVLIPAWRTDILHEVDIIEDIAIAYGYDLLKPKIPEVATIAEENRENNMKRKIAEILIGLGFLETSSYHLIKKEEAEYFKSEQKIEVENSKTEYKLLRPNLLIPALRILAENKDNEYPQNIFEIDKVFSLDKKSETSIKEKESLIISMAPGNFTETKRILNYLTKMLSLKYELKESSVKGLIEGRAGSILINNKNIGYIGELHPETLRAFDIKTPVSVLEISLDEIFDLLDNEE